MRDLRPVPAGQPDAPDSLSVEDKQTLERAVAKILVLGDQVGVSADEMIHLLQGGLTVRELLEYLLSRANDVA